MTSLLSLPPELLSDILQNTAAETVCSCMRVCRLLWELIGKTASLQYKLELAAANLVDAPPSGGHKLALEDRIQRIRCYRNAWDEIHLSEPRILRLPGHTSVGPPRQWVFHPAGVFVEMTATGDFLCTRLPTLLDGHIAMQWTVTLQNSVGIPRRFAIDPSQDLLVVFSTTAGATRLAFHSLTSGAEHALASTKAVESDEPFRHTCCVKIHEDIVILHGSDFADRLWNWKTGVLVFRAPWKYGDVVAFLDNHHMITRTRKAFFVHGFDDDPVAPDYVGTPRSTLLTGVRAPNSDNEVYLAAITSPPPVPQASFCRLDAQRDLYCFAAYVSETQLVAHLLLRILQLSLVDCGAGPAGETTTLPADDWLSRGYLLDLPLSLSPGLSSLRYTTCGRRVLFLRRWQDDPELELEFLEFASANVAGVGSVDTEDANADAASLRVKRRVIRRVRCPEGRLRKVHFWENGIMIQSEDSLHILSLEGR